MFLLNQLRGALTLSMLLMNLAFWGIPVLSLSLLKLLLPRGPWRIRTILGVAWSAERWSIFNSGILEGMLDIEFRIEGADGLSRDRNYLIISNHSTWTDILALHRAFSARIPFIRFFLKQELIWLPIVGQAAWGLEFPFMKRYSSAYLARHPEKRGTDLKTTREMCRRYADFPVTILNFIEGTRFTKKKRKLQNSPFQRLLRPRTGGISYVVASFRDQLTSLLDVTISYPRENISMWDVLTNSVRFVKISVRQLPIPAEYMTDAICERGSTRDGFKKWIQQIWREKDERLRLEYETESVAD